MQDTNDADAVAARNIEDQHGVKFAHSPLAQPANPRQGRTAVAPNAAVCGAVQRCATRHSVAPDACIMPSLVLATAYLTLGRTEESQREFDLGRSAIERDHADDKRLAGELEGIRIDLDKIRAGKALHC